MLNFVGGARLFFVFIELTFPVLPYTIQYIHLLQMNGKHQYGYQIL